MVGFAGWGHGTAGTTRRDRGQPGLKVTREQLVRQVRRDHKEIRELMAAAKGFRAISGLYYPSQKIRKHNGPSNSCS